MREGTFPENRLPTEKKTSNGKRQQHIRQALCRPHQTSRENNLQRMLLLCLVFRAFRRPEARSVHIALQGLQVVPQGMPRIDVGLPRMHQHTYLYSLKRFSPKIKQSPIDSIAHIAERTDSEHTERIEWLYNRISRLNPLEKPSS